MSQCEESRFHLRDSSQARRGWVRVSSISNSEPSSRMREIERGECSTKVGLFDLELWAWSCFFYLRNTAFWLVRQNSIRPYRDGCLCIAKGAVDKQNWQSSIKVIKECYQNYDLVDIKSNYLSFRAGEHPVLPFEGHKFLRFSSNISGRHAQGVTEYIDTITRLAQVILGSRN